MKRVITYSLSIQDLENAILEYIQNTTGESSKNDKVLDIRINGANPNNTFEFKVTIGNE